MFSFEICNKVIKQVALSILSFQSNFTFNLELSNRKGHRNVIMVTYIKGDVFVLIKSFSIIFQVSEDRFI